MPNVFVIDATDVTTDGVIVPTDVDTDVDGTPVEADAYGWGSRNKDQKHDWAVKVVLDENVDADVDVQALATTSDDEAFEEYAAVGDPVTATTGTVPDTVALISEDTVAQYVAAELSADPVPTAGTIRVVFNSRRYG